MRRLFAILSAGLVLAGSALAGPEDEFARVVAIIQQGDQLVADGKDRQAMEEYQRAQKALLSFEKVYPDWDRQVVTFRQRYLSDRLGNWSAKETSKADDHAEELRTLQSRIQFLERANLQYQQQLSQLHAENNRLTGQLREALTIRPAAQEPATVARTQEELEAAKQEVKRLTERTTQLEESLAGIPDPEVAKQNVKILEETRRNLTETLDMAEELRRQNEELRKLMAAKPAPAREPATGSSALQRELLAANAAHTAAVRDLELARAELALLREQLQQPLAPIPGRPVDGRLRVEDAARLALAENRLADALKLLQEETGQSPDNAEAWYLLGRAAALNGDLLSAREALQKAVQLKPDLGVAHYEMARLFHRLTPADHGLPRWHYHKAVASGYPRDAAFEREIGWEQTVN